MKTEMKKQYFFLTLSLLIFNACGDTPRITNTPPNPGTTPTPEITDYYVSPSCSECKTEVKTNKGGGADNILGKGYDVTGDYLAESSLRPQVIDLKKLWYNATSKLMNKNILTYTKLHSLSLIKRC